MIGVRRALGSPMFILIAVDAEPSAAATATELDPDKNSLRFILITLVIGIRLGRRLRLTRIIRQPTALVFGKSRSSVYKRVFANLTDMPTTRD